LVMWTKNGSETLPPVLRRIGQVIPNKIVNLRIIVDDNSSDNTRKIAENFGWQVIPNKGTGIGDGANTALKHVTSEFFISFEQDLILAPDWWKKIPPLLESSHVVVASGVRYANKPVGVRKLQQYVAKKYRGESDIASWLKDRRMSAFTYGKTLDNTIYKTEVMKDLGGFPKLQVNAGVDTTLAYRIKKSGYQWAVNYAVQSIHMRRGLKQELRHQYFYGTQLFEIWRNIKTETNQPPPITRFDAIYRFFTSPFTGLFVSVKTREPTITYIHPLVRFYYLKGLLEASKFEKKT
jgi:glycosyltransferase involved in cell wall biosynthesis